MAPDLHPACLPHGHLSCPRRALSSTGGGVEREDGKGLGRWEGFSRHFLQHGAFQKVLQPFISSAASLRRLRVASALHDGVFHVGVESYVAHCLHRLPHHLPGGHCDPHQIFWTPVEAKKRNRYQTGSNHECVLH